MHNIQILSKDFKRLAFVDNSTPDGLHFTDDKLKTTLDSGIYTLDITFLKSKNHDLAEFVKENNYLYFKNRQNIGIIMTIMSTTGDSEGIRCYCEDATINLTNKIVGEMEAPINPQPIDYYFDNGLFTDDSWVLDNQDIDSKKILEFKNQESALQRLRKIVKEFEAEFYLEADFNELKGTVRFFIRVVKKRLGSNNDSLGFRVTSDDALNRLEREINIDNIVTKIIVRGAEIKEDPLQKTPEEIAQENAPKKPTSTQETYGKMLSDLIKWFTDRKGKVTYSMKYRGGPSSYDCSSAVFSALIYAGFKPKGTRLGSTVDLWNDIGNNKLMREIKASEVQAGDIFLSGGRGNASAGANGHTGVFLSQNTIIHCNATDNGISSTHKNRGGSPMYYFRLNNHWVDKIESSTSAGSSGSSAPKPSPQPSASKHSQIRKKACDSALAKRGKPYVWGATGPNSFDCSGLMIYAYKQAGAPFGYRATTWSMRDCHYPFIKINRSQVQAGDMILSNGYGHVGMAIDNKGNAVWADSSVGVRTRKWTSDPTVCGFRRISGAHLDKYS